MPSEPSVDDILYRFATAIALLNLLGTSISVAIRLCAKQLDARSYRGTQVMTSAGGVNFLIVAFAASALYAIKAVVAQIYHDVRFLVAQVRYFAVYALLNLPTAMLYVLYERRLAAFFSISGKQSIATVYSSVLAVLIAFYVAITVLLTYEHVAYAEIDSTGGYRSAPPDAWYHRVINYAADMCIGATILVGTTHALLDSVVSRRTVAPASPYTHPAAESRSVVAPIYRILLGSDCAKFLVVAAIEAYKLANSSDQTGALGALPAGNGGLQHTVDAVKIAVMTLSLFAPVEVARQAAKKSLEVGRGGLQAWHGWEVAVTGLENQATGGRGRRFWSSAEVRMVAAGLAGWLEEVEKEKAVITPASAAAANPPSPHRPLSGTSTTRHNQFFIKQRYLQPSAFLIASQRSSPPCLSASHSHGPAHAPFPGEWGSAGGFSAHFATVPPSALSAQRGLAEAIARGGSLRPPWATIGSLAQAPTFALDSRTEPEQPEPPARTPDPSEISQQQERRGRRRRRTNFERVAVALEVMVETLVRELEGLGKAAEAVAALGCEDVRRGTERLRDAGGG
ncbi:hypothetical protein DFJ73DRAFT_924877 [Zopfochytrium polystomum]|nr:hypothetical protein DFJ73DRAFT_924877 [Zopfochytrium polystomum]